MAILSLLVANLGLVVVTAAAIALIGFLAYWMARPERV